MWLLNMRRCGVWCCLVATGFAALSPPVAASEQTTIDLETAIRRTLERNPNLLAVGYQIEVEQGRLTQSRLRPNLQFGVLTENVLGTGNFKGADSAETTLSLGWVLERGKRERRIAAATAGVSLAESDAEIDRLDAAADTARLFLNSLANQARLIRTQAAVSLAKRSVAAVGERVSAGRTPDADLARAEAQLARVELSQEDIEHALLTSNHRLAAQWGESTPGFLTVAGDIEKLPVPDSFAGLLARVEQNPNLARYLTEQRLREAELRLAQSQARPNWRVNAGIRRLEQSNDQAFVAGITIPLATRNRNQGRIAEARARLAMTDAGRTAARVQTETQLFALYQELQHSLHQTAVFRDKVLPRVEQALADTQTAYATGRYGYFELQLVQTEVLDTRSALVEASIDAHKRLIEIERLTGTTVLSSVAQP